MTQPPTLKTKGWEPFIPKPSTLEILLPLLRGLSNWKSTLILIKFAWSNYLARRSISMNLPMLFPSSLPTSSNISSNGSLHIWTQKGEWVKFIFVAESPLHHLHNNSRLLSKFHGPFCPTHFIWYSDLNLNCIMLFPTSTICKSEPIFHTIYSMFFSSLKFWFLSTSRRPNRLSEHSSNRSDLHLDLMELFSSSSFVRRRLDRPSTTVWSMAVLGRKKEMNSKKSPCYRWEGEMTWLNKTREKNPYLGEKNWCKPFSIWNVLSIVIHVPISFIDTKIVDKVFIISTFILYRGFGVGFLHMHWTCYFIFFFFILFVIWK